PSARAPLHAVASSCARVCLDKVRPRAETVRRAGKGRVYGVVCCGRLACAARCVSLLPLLEGCLRCADPLMTDPVTTQRGWMTNTGDLDGSMKTPQRPMAWHHRNN
ncbi:unnamed protein product, partial [Sphacelaria rigidula]